MATIYFANERKSLDVLPGTNLGKVALRSGTSLHNVIQQIFHLNLRVGPFALFTAFDLVNIDGKGASPRSEAEEKALSGRLVTKYKLTPSLRIASQVFVTGDITVHTRAKREVDKELTNEQRGYPALLCGFTVLMVLVLGLVGLDLLKIL
jgi:hypothetical protein